MAAGVSNMSLFASNEGRSTGKRYAEVAINGDFFGIFMSNPGEFQIGLTPGTPAAGTTTGGSGGVAWRARQGVIEQTDVTIWPFGSVGLLTFTDVVCMAMDLDALKLWIAKNDEAWIGGGDPDAGTSPTATLASGQTWYIGTCCGNNVAFGPAIEPFYWSANIRTRTDQFTRLVRPVTFPQFA
jgi:hypothetical protein